MSIRRSRRNLAPVSYNAREIEPVLPERKIKIIDDEEESQDEFPDEEDNQEDEDVSEVIEGEDELSDDDEISEAEDDELSDEAADDPEVSPRSRSSRSSRQTRRPTRRRRVPEAMYPEDVPWKSPLEAPEPDPANLEYHPAVGWLVMFMGTFSASFADLGGYGPQDIEEGVLEANFQIHKLFARLLGLVLNRKKEIEYKRYVSALQELHSQLPNFGSLHRLPALQWKSQDVFDSLSPFERLEFLHLLALWSLQTSKTLQQQMTKLGPESIICYTGFDDALNRYYFCKGIVGDTRFRLYRESNPYLSVVNWTPVASDCDELMKLAQDLSNGGDCGELSNSLVQILEEFLPIARESEDRRLKEEKRLRRHNLIAREVEQIRSEPREGRRNRVRRVDYSMLAYDQEFERQVTKKKRPREDKDWGSPQPEEGSRQSRRLRGTAPDQSISLEEVEAAAKARAMGLAPRGESAEYEDTYSIVNLESDANAHSQDILPPAFNAHHQDILPPSKVTDDPYGHTPNGHSESTRILEYSTAPPVHQPVPAPDQLQN